MQQTIETLKVTLRGMTALSHKQQPDSADVETLRRYLGTSGPSDLGELAREVFEKTLAAPKARLRNR